MSVVSSEQRPAPGWLSWHVHVAADPTGTDHLAPLIAGPLAELIAAQRAAGRVRNWFFIRYWEGGPHLRLRILPAAADDAGPLDAAVHAAFRDVPTAGHDPAVYLDGVRDLARASLRADPTVDPHLAGLVREPGVHRAVYTPETDRYGTGERLALSEAAFAASSDLAVHSAGQSPSAVQLRLLGIETICKAAHRARPHDVDGWLQRYAAYWRTWAGPGPTAVFPADRLATEAVQWATVLRERAGVTADRLIRRGGPLAAWDTALAAVLDGVADGPEAAARRESLCISHSHMTLNRLGLLVHDEFALIETARCLLPVPAGA
ncbi:MULTISPECIES: thiopeptide-type bacteriocin biosynthesis protein [Streptomyces]|uniref:Thiopeptide-type bacteriocin biosynthesis domain-containing protein n=1 Tax=Streptomyces luteosporeus TaxID=173856 RepID=A0ABP6G3J7_9ACTN